ncbi:MAG TPA: T9SS type A sorting domain-containing protein [Candidatus Kapabacteria bacterium]|jgi:hypothetical protein|nr:T9SS type A sorting domain-containing protein [Candidatus Kapabacteria bacterium]
MSPRIFLIAAILLFCASGSSDEAYGSWQPLYVLPVQAIDFYNPHLGLVATQSGDITRFDDSTALLVYQAGFVTSIAIQDSGTAWFTVKNVGLFKGDHYWQHWVNTLTDSNLILVGATPSFVFIYSDSELYYTSNGIAAAPTIGIPRGDSIRALDYLTPKIVIAVSSKHIYRSANSGLTWNLVDTGMTDCASVFADRAHGLIYTGGDELRESLDGGITWRVIPVPSNFDFRDLGGQVAGAHDCSGTFYISNDSTRSSILRSQDQCATFEIAGTFPNAQSYIQKGWTFDRGSSFYWWDSNTRDVFVSRDGIDGLITPSLRSFVEVTADPILDTICSSQSRPFSVNIFSSVCTGLVLDSISVVRAQGNFNLSFKQKILFGDSSRLTLSYFPYVEGIDSATLRLWIHSQEWGQKDSLDFPVTATVLSLPPTLLSTDSLIYGDVPVDSSKKLTLDITNVGCRPLRIDSVISSNPELFTVRGPSLPLYLSSDSTLNFTVIFSPRTAGEAVESIELGTNAGHKFIELDGIGTEKMNVANINMENSPLLVYPNPASTTLYFSSEFHSKNAPTFDLYDMLGRNVLHQQVPSSDGIGVGALQEGMYTAIVNDQTARVIICRK